MSNITKISSSKDKLLDKLIDDKNRLFMKLKKLEKDITVLNNQIKYWRSKCKYLDNQRKEAINELFERNNSEVNAK
jgi:chaperonin cofactor prefoldin